MGILTQGKSGFVAVHPSKGITTSMSKSGTRHQANVETQKDTSLL